MCGAKANSNQIQKQSQEITTYLVTKQNKDKKKYKINTLRFDFPDRLCNDLHMDTRDLIDPYIQIQKRLQEINF